MPGRPSCNLSRSPACSCLGRLQGGVWGNSQPTRLLLQSVFRFQHAPTRAACRAVYGAAVAKNALPLALKQEAPAGEEGGGASFEIEVQAAAGAATRFCRFAAVWQTLPLICGSGCSGGPELAHPMRECGGLGGLASCGGCEKVSWCSGAIRG
jgi:hypothetical protein